MTNAITGTLNPTVLPSAYLGYGNASKELPPVLKLSKELLNLIVKELVKQKTSLIPLRFVCKHIANLPAVQAEVSSKKFIREQIRSAAEYAIGQGSISLVSWYHDCLHYPLTEPPPEQQSQPRPPQPVPNIVVTWNDEVWETGGELLQRRTVLGNYKFPNMTEDKEKPLPPEIDDEDDLPKTDDVEHLPLSPTRDFSSNSPPPPPLPPKRMKATLRRLPKPPAEKPPEQPPAAPPTAKPGAPKPPTRPTPRPPHAKQEAPKPPTQPVAPLLKPNLTPTSLPPSTDFLLPDISKPSSPGGSEIRSSSYIGSSNNSGASTPSEESHYHGVPTVDRRQKILKILARLEEQNKSNEPASRQQSFVPRPPSIPKVLVTESDEWATGGDEKQEPQRKPGANTFKLAKAELAELMKQQMLEEQAEEAEEDKKKPG